MPIQNEVLKTLFSVQLRTRILREWQKANRAQDQEFSERELLTLELVEGFGPITEKGLCKIFGLSFSSISDIIKKLGEADLLDKSEKARGKPLALTKKGQQTLEDLKKVSAKRFEYLFESFSDEEWKDLMRLFDKVQKNVERYTQRL